MARIVRLVSSFLRDSPAAKQASAASVTPTRCIFEKIDRVPDTVGVVDATETTRRAML